MRKFGFAALAGAAALSMLMSSATATLANVSEKFYGRVVHVSDTNLKVQNPTTGKVMSFVFVPGATKIVEDTGNPKKMADVHPGQAVEVIYDTTALGARHLDQIITLHRGMSSR